MTPSKTLREASCADDHDPDSMPVERARALIRDYLEPVATVERLVRPASQPGLRYAIVLGQYGIERWDVATDERRDPSEDTLLARVGDGGGRVVEPHARRVLVREE